MADLIKCKACQGDVAKSAKACPKCGAPVPRMGCLKLMGIGFGALIVLGVIGQIAGGGSKNLEKTADRMQAQALGQPVQAAAPAVAAPPVVAAKLDWEKPWTEVKPHSASKCAETFPALQLQAVCMKNEREGYDKMKGDFGMPPDIARQAKERCTEMFDQFQLQAVCMGNERDGYRKMKE